MARPARFIERVVWRRIVGDGYKFAGFVLLLAKLFYGAASAVHLFGYQP